MRLKHRFWAIWAGIASAGLSSSFAIRNVAAADVPIRVGAAAVNLRCDGAMVLAGMLDPRFSSEQEGELRAVAVVVERPGFQPIAGTPDTAKIAIVGCDVLWIPRDLVDSALDEVHKKTGIRPECVLINASHTHHAPSPAPAHNFGVHSEFRAELRNSIVKAIVQANDRLKDGDARAYFQLGEEKTVGANSRLRLPNHNITWLNPIRETTISETKVEPTGPFDPQLPVLDFRNPSGRSIAMIFNHSTHTIGTKSNKNVRSPSFYGLAAQELEKEIGGVVNFLEGASGSTHNIHSVPVAECIVRMKKAVLDARLSAQPIDVTRMAAIRRPFHFTVRKFDEAEEDAKVLRYLTRYAPQQADYIRNIFATMRRQLAPHRGEECVTWVQAIRIGDVAFVGAPAEYFTALGIDIKKRSPFKNTVVAELANDWVGYMPTRQSHADGGYQTWMGLHSYAEIGTGERVADAIVEMLEELAGKRPFKPEPVNPPSGPKTPAEEKVAFRLADPKLEIELVAAEPDVVSPVAMAWDADGRLYVAEMFGYPQTPNACRIVRLEDRDGDGHYETRTVFADGLSFPTSVLPYGKGILVATAPDIIYLEDTNGDGKADIRKVMLTGFGTGSQQLRANALHYGIDNGIYGANGRCDGEIKFVDDPERPAVSIRATDFRFQDIRIGKNSVLAFAAITGQSQFGQAHDDWGNRFLSWNTIPIRHALIESQHLKYAPEQATNAVVDLTPVDDTHEIFTIAPPPQQFNSEKANFYNAMCGLTIFRGDALGPEYAGDAFIGESLSNVVTRRKLTPDGPTFKSHRPEVGQEFLASYDSWFHPVFMTTGPDGCLYIADFYRQYVEHPIYVASEAHRTKVDWRAGAGHGRIWRIRRADHNRTRTSLLPITKPIQLSKIPPTELVKLLEHPVGWQRDTAQRLLVEGRGDKVAEALEQLISSSRFATSRIHALWTLSGIQKTRDETIIKALVDGDARVRWQASRIANFRIAKTEAIRRAFFAMSKERDPAVRFQLLMAMREIPTAERLPKIAEMLGSSEPDKWISIATTIAASDAPHELALLLDQRDGAWFAKPTDARFAFLTNLGRSIARDVAPESQKTFLRTLEQTRPATSYPGTLALFAGWIDATVESRRLPREAFPGIESTSIAKVAATLLAASETNSVRRLASVGCLTVGSSSEVDAMLEKLLNDPSAELANKAANVLADRNESAGCRILFANWQQRPPTIRRAILAAARRSKAASEALVEAVEQNRVALPELPLDVEATLRNPQSVGAELAARFNKLASQSMSADREAVVQSYKPVLTMSGDAKAGAAVFRDNCLTCHAIAGTGNKVGPDLAGVAGRSKTDLLIDILDPSRRVSPDFVGYLAVTKSGQVVTGLVVSETAQAVTLRQERGVDMTIPRSDLEELRASKKSLMPDGHEKKIDHRQMADLLEFLRQPDRTLLLK